MSDHPERAGPEWGWWTIYGEDLMAMLCRVQSGENPDIVYAEEYANAVIEPMTGSDQ